MAWRRGSVPVTEAAPIETFTLTGREPGPLLAVFGGVHGDEPEGVFAARAIAGMDLDLLCGEVIVVPVAHPAAFAADTRTGPDGANLARVFPGIPDGSPTERVAFALVEAVLAKADALLDLHTAGRHYAMPLLAGFGSTGSARETAIRMAEAFGADFVWHHPDTAEGRTLSVMQARNKPAIYTEAPGGGTLDRATLDRFIEGVQRVMAALGMLAPPPPLKTRALTVFGAGDLDKDVMIAPAAGYFCAAVEVGAIVPQGGLIGQILRLGEPPIDIRAAHEAVVMYLRRTALIAADTALANLAHLQPDSRT